MKWWWWRKEHPANGKVEAAEQRADEAQDVIEDADALNEKRRPQVEHYAGYFRQHQQDNLTQLFYAGLSGGKHS